MHLLTMLIFTDLDTALLFHVDTKHVSGFDPAQLELAKALVRSWQQRYPEVKADIPCAPSLQQVT